jgi:transcriptional regulator with XRE-family HTH domain
MILAEKRKAVNLTQAQCADMVGVTRITWIRWETGQSSMPIATLRLWLHLAGIELLPNSAAHIPNSANDAGKLERKTGAEFSKPAEDSGEK